MKRVGLGGLRSVTGDSGDGDWVVAGVRAFSEHAVGSLVPDGFERYARVFHPAYLGDQDREVRWADIADVSMETEPWERGPSLWWPADRAWCVATDVDLMSTYIGGSGSCLEDLLSETGLEVWPVNPDQGLTLDSDDLNPR